MGTTKSIDHVHNHELETKCPSNESATDCIKTPIVSLYKFHQVLGKETKYFNKTLNIFVFFNGIIYKIIMKLKTRIFSIFFLIK